MCMRLHAISMGSNSNFPFLGLLLHLFMHICTSIGAVSVTNISNIYKYLLFYCIVTGALHCHCVIYYFLTIPNIQLIRQKVHMSVLYSVCPFCRSVVHFSGQLYSITIINILMVVIIVIDISLLTIHVEAIVVGHQNLCLLYPTPYTLLFCTALFSTSHPTWIVQDKQFLVVFNMYVCKYVCMVCIHNTL